MDHLLPIRLLIAVVGLVPMGIVLLKMRANRGLIRRGVKTQGVIRAVHGRSSDGINAADIQYTTQGGAHIMKRVMTSARPHQVGETLPLIYDPDDPQRMMLGWKNNYTVILVMAGALAIAFIAFAVMLDEG